MSRLYLSEDGIQVRGKHRLGKCPEAVAFLPVPRKVKRGPCSWSRVSKRERERDPDHVEPCRLLSKTTDVYSQRDRENFKQKSDFYITYIKILFAALLSYDQSIVYNRMYILKTYNLMGGCGRHTSVKLLA